MSRTAGRWICWSVAAATYSGLSAIVAGWTRLGDMEAGAPTLVAVLVLTLIIAGWVLPYEGQRAALAEEVGRIAALAEATAHLQYRQLEREAGRSMPTQRARSTPQDIIDANPNIVDLDDIRMLRQLDAKLRRREGDEH